ncbi:hypothetical protein [Peribacillus muralis]|uniref:hypothetical protein n=1 Tax=Peribacillus muralis TaxID=264697 RepID=UPI0036715332
MYKSDQLYDEMKEIEGKIKSIAITDAESLVEYFKQYTLLIYNYKWIGSVYDIYANDVSVIRENGQKLIGAGAIVQDTTELLAAFPDLELTFSDCFAVPDDHGGYKLWRHFYLDGTNLGYSKYGVPTGKSLENKKSIGLSMSTVRFIEGKWRILYEYTMYSGEWIKQVCTK